MTLKQVESLFRKQRTLRSGELVAAGVSRARISRMLEAGELARLARGVYALPDYQLTEFGHLAIVAQRVPKALFCLLSALRIHDLTSQAPREVWIALGNRAHLPKLEFPPVRVVRFSPVSLAEGVEEHVIEGVTLQVTCVAKTVVDCFKFRNQIGLDVAIEALRSSRQAKRARADELWRFAKVDRVTNVIRPYLEAVE